MNLAAVRQTILLVEDDFVLRTSLAELLIKQGYMVECAAHGREAFHRLNTGRPKPFLILLDMAMPYMDGREFQNLKQADPAVADVPVIIITANGEYAAQAVRPDVKQTFYKPVNTARLLKSIDDLARAATC
ncbi:MAG TPA: response regulator [Polyangia bacterium]|nr:response regulator [Polyangia bacterium]